MSEHHGQALPPRGKARGKQDGIGPIYYVIDMETGNVAKGTKQEGYKNQEEAADIARDYRDEYGAYVRSPF